MKATVAKKISITVLGLLCFLSVPAQLLFKVSADSLITFSYGGGDEFNAPALNTNYWKDPWTKVNMAQEFRYNPQNVVMENGVVNFVMKKQDSLYQLMPHEVDSVYLKQQKQKLQSLQYGLKYSAGMIISKDKFHYGLYELRFKVEEGKGVWPAFWFFGGNKNEEIDAFELKGERNDEIHVDTHCPYGCDKGYRTKLGTKTNWGGWMPVSDYLHNGYATLSLEWKPGELLWYINGYPLAYFRGDFPNPMNLFLNTQVARDGRAFKPGPDAGTPFPNNFYVDYIRIWKPLPPGTPAVLKAAPGFEISDRFSPIYAAKPLKKRGLMYIKNKFNPEEGQVSLTLSPEHILTVKVQGELASPGTSVVFKGKQDEYTVTDFSKESLLRLKPGEEQLELLIKTRQREYRQNISISQ